MTPSPSSPVPRPGSRRPEPRYDPPTPRNTNDKGTPR